MSQRKLYLALYYVADPSRLASTLSLIRGHAYGGQKSAYEVYLIERQLPTLRQCEERFIRVPATPPGVAIKQHSLQAYGQLFGGHHAS